jgi:hypothetical protein
VVKKLIAEFPKVKQKLTEGAPPDGSAESEVSVDSVGLAACSVGLADSIAAVDTGEEYGGSVGTNFEHDDHSSIHILNEKGSKFLVHAVVGNVSVVGFDDSLSVPGRCKGEMCDDLGEAVVVSTAGKNLLSAIQLRKAYKVVIAAAEEVVYEQKTCGSRIVFRLESDGYYHTRLSSRGGWAGASSMMSLSVADPDDE